MAGGQDGFGDDRVRREHEGTLIAGRYRLLERLGAGGMGRVWRARDEQLDCDVALKEVWLPPMLSDDERGHRLARAGREAKNAARLRNHPHIVSIHDLVDEQGMPWIVMDLIPSQNLSEVVRAHGPLPLDQVVTIAVGVLEALSASHAAGILHRDVKPANVLLTHDGRVLLTDFGIAIQESDLTMTASGVLVGSPEYVAPERARGEASKAASDLFSLGATLYFAAEGKSPFARETAVGVLTAILFEEAAAVTRQPSLAPLIGGLLEKDPDHRWDEARVRQELTKLGGRPSLGAAGAGAAGAVAAGAAGAEGPAETLVMPPTPSAEAAPSPMPFPAPVPMSEVVTPTPVAYPMPAPQNPWQQQPQGQGWPPQGPPPMGWPGVPQGPPPKKNTGRNVGILAVVVLVIAGVIAIVALQKPGNNNVSINNTGSTNTTSPSAGATQPATSAAATSAATTTTDAPTTTTDSPTTDAPSTDLSTAVAPTFDPAQLNEQTTDTTPLTTDALFPQSFTDSKGVLYNLKSGGEENCVNDYESTHVKDILNSHNCVNAVVATYVDSTNKILVAVQIMAMSDEHTAIGVYDALKDAYSNDWGIWCPQDGPGAQICSNGEDISQATQYGWFKQTHRYLIHSIAVYINLTQDASVKPWVMSSSEKAADAAGPQNYAGNQ